MTSGVFIDGLRAGLRTTADVADWLTSPLVWTPQPGSPGQAEVTNTESGPQGPWGDRSVRTAYAAAAMGIKVATEYARSMEAIIAPLRSPLVPETLARSALEAAASSWWLLEQGLDARRRVCRLQLVRIKSAIELERAVAEVGVSNAGGAYGETPDQVRDYSNQLGLAPFLDKGRDQAAICETETRPGYTERVKALLGDWNTEGTYNIYSGTAHAEPYAVLRYFKEVRPPETDGSPIRQLAPDPTGLHWAVDAVLLAVTAPLERACFLFGWHADAGPGAVLSATIDRVNQQVAALAPPSKRVMPL